MNRFILMVMLASLGGCAITPEQKCAGLLGMDGYAKCYEHAANADYYRSQQSAGSWAATANAAMPALNMMNNANYQNQMLWQQQQMNNNMQMMIHEQGLANQRAYSQQYVRPFMDSARH